MTQNVTLTTNMGAIQVALDEKAAPKTVANFISYVQKGHYNQTIFHRVIDGFMIQGGGFTEAMEAKPTDPPIENEAHNGLKNEIGTIAMARTQDPHSASCQFFINVANNTFLDHSAKTGDGWGYTVFGHVISGKDVIEKIARLETSNHGPHQNVPTQTVLIETATLDEASLNTDDTDDKA
ncbi:MAG: peptidylprolyl isomerase [Gammaproteobacteria bacterium]